MERKQETVTPNTWIDQAMEKIREQIATKSDQQMVDVIIEIYNFGIQILLELSHKIYLK